MSARAVLVTGGASGIGWATARRFAAVGDRVLIADIDGERAAARAAELGPDHAAIRADIGRREDVVAMISACVSRLGRIDVLVNNAGRIDTGGTGVADQPTEAFRGLLAVNLDGTALAAEAAARLMKAQGGGAIVNVASGAAIRAIPLRNAYSASKAGVVALTRNLACRLAADGIQVNAVAPGYTRTELVDALIRNGRVDPARAAQRIPLGRMGTPEEMAEAIFHLASPAARAMVGSLLVVDGGSQAYGGSEDVSVPRGAAPTAPPPGRKVIVVAGAASAIGAAAARLAAGEGARVVVLERPGVAITAPAVADALALSTDFADGAAVDAAIAGAADRFGRLDGLVNAIDADEVAAGAPGWSVAEGLDRYVTGLFHAARAAGRVMLGQGHGAVCNVTSILGQVGLTAGEGAAAASAAVSMFTRTLACEWGGSGIRVNALAAGIVGDDRHPLIGRIPARRAVTPDEIAANIGFLMSPAASFINGALVPVDGGLGIYAGPDLPAG